MGLGRWGNVLAKEKVDTFQFKQNPATLKVSKCVTEKPWLDPNLQISRMQGFYFTQMLRTQNLSQRTCWEKQEKQSAGGLLEEDKRLFIVSCNWLKLIIFFLSWVLTNCCTVRNKPCLDFLDIFMSEKWTKLFLQAFQTCYYLVCLLVDKVVASPTHLIFGLKLLAPCYEDPLIVPEQASAL